MHGRCTASSKAVGYRMSKTTGGRVMYGAVTEKQFSARDVMYAA